MTDLSKIKVFSCDLDDTLLRDDLSIDEFDGRMMRRLQQKGIHVVLCSGRRGFDCQKKFAAMRLKEENEYIIGCAGGEVIEAGSGRNLYNVVLDETTIRAVIDYCRGNNYCLEVYVGIKHLAATVDNEFHRYHIGLVKLEHMKFSFEEILEYSLKNPPMKYLICHDPHLISSKIAPDILSIVDKKTTRVVISKPCFVEILPADVSKGSALRWLCANVLHCSMTEVVSAGDGNVDVEMLRECGLSFAVANAIEAAKRVATTVLPWTNQQRAVGRMIRKYFFGEGDEEEEEDGK